MQQRRNQLFLYIVFLSALVFSFQNCSPNLNSDNQNNNGSFNDGGGEPYPGDALLIKTYVVNSSACPDGLSAFIITKLDTETYFTQTTDNCLNSNRKIASQEIEWVTAGVSFNFEGHLYEIKPITVPGL